MTKRLQVPISKSDETLLKMAAKREGLPTAEWARRLLLEKAREQFGGKKSTPEQALMKLFSLEAPVASIKQMMKEATKGRLW